MQLDHWVTNFQDEVLGSQVPILEVEQLYEEGLTALKAGARITKFLSIITSRKVREKLRKRAQKT